MTQSTLDQTGNSSVSQKEIQENSKLLIGHQEYKDAMIVQVKLQSGQSVTRPEMRRLLKTLRRKFPLITMEEIKAKHAPGYGEVTFGSLPTEEQLQQAISEDLSNSETQQDVATATSAETTTENISPDAPKTTAPARKRSKPTKKDSETAEEVVANMDNKPSY